MIKKFESVLDLLKVGGLADHYKKAASFHKAKAGAHEAMATAHTNQSAMVKAHADGLDDGDAHKAFMKAHADFHAAKAAHHATLHALHKAHGDHLNTLSDGLDDGEKAAAAAGQKCEHDLEMTKACEKCNRKAAEPSGSVDLSTLFSGALKADFEEFRKGPEFKGMIQQYIKREAAKALGLEMEPTQVRGTIPSNPLTLVKRPGGFDPEEQEDEIDASNPMAAEVFGS